MIVDPAESSPRAEDYVGGLSTEWMIQELRRPFLVPRTFRFVRFKSIETAFCGGAFPENNGFGGIQACPGLMVA